MSRDPVPPITLGEVRRLGFPLSITCAMCNRSRQGPLYVARGLPDNATMHDLAKRFRCTECKLTPRAGISVQPHHQLWVAHLRQSGQRHRLPYWTPFMREEEDAKALKAFASTGSLP